MINLELFCCAGGMAAGFRRAGVRLDVAVDFEADHCDSYEANLGHRPVQMDVHDLVRLAKIGAFAPAVDLLVADPPCTPWSRAGKRLGTEDDRDMLEATCELIRLLRPRRYLIGNVPGLDDRVNLPIVQRVIGGLSAVGYCTADFARLDAADYGVPQHRHRPFWFGHLDGPCIRWQAPTHADPAEVAARAATAPLAGIGAPPLLPWVTCRQALGHLEGEDLGRAVKMRRRARNGHQLGGVADRPARVVGTSNLSDGNTLAIATRHEQPVHTSDPDAPARAITTQCRVAGHATTLVLNGRHAPAELDAPAPTLGAKYRGQGAQVLTYDPQHPPSYGDEPAMVVRAGCGAGATRAVQFEGRCKRPPSTQGPQSTRIMSADAPSTTVQAREDRMGSGSPVLEWPWPRPATAVACRAGLAPPGHHDEDFAIMSLPDAVILSERAASILQGFPDDGSWKFCGETKKARWSQIGQAMPPALAHAVARSVVEQDKASR